MLSINQLLVQDENGDVSLGHVARSSRQRFIEHIQAFSEQDIALMLMIKNRQGDTPLHLIAQYQCHEGFNVFIEKCRSIDLKLVLTIQNDYGCTVLHTVARYQGQEGFLRCVNYLNSDELRDALTIKNQRGTGIMHLVGRYQSPETFELFSEKL